MNIYKIIGVTIVSAAVIAGCSRKNEPAPSGSESGEPSASPAASAQGVWLTDFEAAKAKADQEDKDLLAFFTGSDWCYWCKRLDGEVFAKPGFVDEANKDFVFVKLDYPSNPGAQPRALRTQNQRLSRVYGVQGYPTVILMEADGRPYAETGYQEGGPDKYLAHLEQLRQQR